MVTVPKPTQVGEMNILRRASDLSLRNSANFFRNFGRRKATFGEDIYCRSWVWSQRKDPGDCLAKTQHYAKLQSEVYGVMPAQCQKVKGKCYS